MGYSQAQKEKTHKRIVAIASTRFRKMGLAGFGITDSMKGAGLTVGGFYKHFDPRDELVAEALNDAFGTWQRQKEAAARCESEPSHGAPPTIAPPRSRKRERSMTRWRAPCPRA